MFSQKGINIGDFTYFPSHSLGKGATGQVFQGRNNYTNETVAVKVIELKEMNTPRKRLLLECQINGLRSIHHPFVLNVFQITQDASHVYIPSELCPNGTLRDYIKSKKYLSENEAMSIFEKIVQGYCHIVKSGFIHRDLKTENILLRQNMEPVIIDFGYCEKNKTQYEKLSYNVGSPAYMSPQAYNESVYSEKSDVWALGVILHEMMTGTIPKMWTLDVNRYFRELSRQETAVIVPAYQSQYCMQLLKKMLTVNLHSRPNSEQINYFIKNKNSLSPVKGQLQSKNRIKSSKSLKEIPLAPLSMKKIPTYFNPNHEAPSDFRNISIQNNHNQEAIMHSQKIIESPTRMPKGNNRVEMGYHSKQIPPKRNNNFEMLRNKITSNNPLRINHNENYHQAKQIFMTPTVQKKSVHEMYSPYREPQSAMMNKSNFSILSSNSPTKNYPGNHEGNYPESISSFDSPMRKSFPVKMRRQISGNQLVLHHI